MMVEVPGILILFFPFCVYSIHSLLTFPFFLFAFRGSHLSPCDLALRFGWMV